MNARKLVVNFPTPNVSVLYETLEMIILIWESRASCGNVHEHGLKYRLVAKLERSSRLFQMVVF